MIVLASRITLRAGNMLLRTWWVAMTGATSKRAPCRTLSSSRQRLSESLLSLPNLCFIYPALVSLSTHRPDLLSRSSSSTLGTVVMASSPNLNESRAPLLMAIIWIVAFISTTLATCRLFTRTTILKAAGKDDIAIILSVVASSASHYPINLT